MGQKGGSEVKCGLLDDIEEYHQPIAVTRIIDYVEHLAVPSCSTKPFYRVHNFIKYNLK